MKDFKILPLVLLLLLLFALNLDLVTFQYAKANRVEASPLPALKTSSYPVVLAESQPVVSAQSAIVMDDDSKVILFSKNPNLRFSTASTAKIMTALVAVNHYKMEDELTIQEEFAEGFVLGFKKGERFTFLDLLYTLLLPSANDAALAIAQNYPGGEVAFVEEMNQVAQSLHLPNTHFADTSGLIDDQNYTTALDLARLASYALENGEFRKIVSTKHRVFSNIEGSMDYSIYNRNKLLGSSGIDGIKTGYTEEAGQVLVTSKLHKGHRLIAVVMGSDNRFLDTLTLLNFISQNLTYLPIHP